MSDIELFDTHAHIHFSEYPLDAEDTWRDAQQSGVSRMLSVGCRLEDSQGAVAFAQKHDNVWAAVGIHPHEATDFLSRPEAKQAFEKLLTKQKVVAIGEIGLDFYYHHSIKEDQIALLEWQLGLAEAHNLPVIFHVRDAFDDFWPLFDRFSIKKGLIHSFTGVKSDVEQILQRNLWVALNGIMTFTKVQEQLEAAKAVPLERLLLETDAPYLTPKPFRGNICKPEHVRVNAEFLADLRGEPLEVLAAQTTQNARQLFNV